MRRHESETVPNMDIIIGVGVTDFKRKRFFENVKREDVLHS